MCYVAKYQHDSNPAQQIIPKHETTKLEKNVTSEYTIKTMWIKHVWQTLAAAFDPSRKLQPILGFPFEPQSFIFIDFYNISVIGMWHMFIDRNLAKTCHVWIYCKSQCKSNLFGNTLAAAFHPDRKQQRSSKKGPPRGPPREEILEYWFFLANWMGGIEILNF